MMTAAVDNYMGRDSSNTQFRIVMLNIRTGSGPGSPSGQPAWGGGSDLAGWADSNGSFSLN